MASSAVPRWMDDAASLAWRFLLIVAAVGVCVSVLIGLSVVVLPLILAVFLASVFAPVSQFLRGHGWRPALAALACVLLLAVVLGLLLWLVISALVGPWSALEPQLSKGLDILQEKLNELFDSDLSTSSGSIRENLGGSVSFLIAGALGVVSVVTGLVSTVSLSLLVMFFYLKDGEALWGWVTALGGRNRSTVDRVGRAMWVKVDAFIKGTAMVAAVDGIGISLGALMIGTPSVAAIGVLTFVLGFIPFFGAIFAGAIACLIAVADGGLRQGLAMVLVVLVVQQLESNVLQPMLVGRAVRLHPLVVALGVIAGGVVAGVLGMFFAVPIIAAAVAGVRELKAVQAIEKARAIEADQGSPPPEDPRSPSPCPPTAQA